jgi:hypothetical protein
MVEFLGFDFSLTVSPSLSHGLTQNSKIKKEQTSRCCCFSARDGDELLSASDGDELLSASDGDELLSATDGDGDVRSDQGD